MKIVLQVPVNDVCFTVKFTDKFKNVEEVDFCTYEDAISHMDICEKYDDQHVEMFVKIEKEI